MENRYKIVINKEVEHHSDAVNEHIAISNVLDILRADGYMLPITCITVEGIVDSQESERQAIINKLICIDSNGVWSDEDNIANDYEPMSLQEAKEALYRIEHRDDEPEFDLATVAKEIGGDYVNTGGHCYMVTKDLYNGFVIAITDDCIAIYENFEAIFDGSFDSCNTPVYSI